MATGSEVRNDLDVLGNLTVQETVKIGVTDGAGTSREIIAQGAVADIDIILTPKGSGLVKVPSGYESLIAGTDESVINYGYFKQRILTLEASATAQAPGAGQDQYGLVYDHATTKWDLKAVGVAKTYTDGLTETSGVVRLGGDIDETLTDIKQTATGDIYIQAFQGTNSAGLRAYTPLNNDNRVELFYGSTSKIALQNDSFTITANVTGSMKYAADYSGLFTSDRSIPDRGWINTHLGGKLVSSLITTPTGTHHGWVIKWDNVNNYYTLEAVVSGGVTTFTGLTDTPGTYVGEALKAVRVNVGETGLEFYTPSSSGHVIENSGTPLTARANLNFKDGLIAADNDPDTDVYVDVNYSFTWTALHIFNAGLNLAGGQSIDVVATGGSDVLNIGTSNADVINIGYSSSTINIQGTLAYQNVTNLQVTDKLITLNKGGGVASGVSSGFEIEENAIITGYFATNGARNGYDFKAPAITGVATLSLASLTGNQTYTLQDGTGTLYQTGGTDVAVADGGTNISSYTVGDLLYASGATTLSKLADVATGNALISGGVGVAPSWGKITSSHIDATVQTAGLSWLLASGGTLTGNNTITGTGFTLKGVWTALGTTQTDGYGLWLANTTVAALGAQQISPSTVWEGQGWETTGSTSQSMKVSADMLPVQGTTLSGTWRLRHSINNASYITDLSLTTGFAASGPTLSMFTSAGTNFFSVSPNIITLTTASGVNTFRITSGNPMMLLGPSGNGFIPIDNTATGTAGTSIGMRYTAAGGVYGTTNVHHDFFGPASAINSWVSTINHVRIAGSSNTIQPSSGAGGWINLLISSTYNITGTATGVIAGIYYNPTLTSMTGISEHYAWRSSSGSFLIGNSSSDTLTSGARVDIRGTGTSTNKGFRFADSANTERFYIQDNGAATFVNKVSFTADATNSGLNIGSFAGSPSSLSNGDIWYDSTNTRAAIRIGATTYSIMGLSPSGATTGGVAIMTSTAGIYTSGTSMVFASAVLNVAGAGIFTQTAKSSAWNNAFKVIAGANTALTAATEFVSIDFVGATQTWNDGTVTTQRFNYFRGYTANKTTTAATFTDIYNVYIDTNTAGSGVTFTRNWALGVAGNLMTSGSMYLGAAGVAPTSFLHIAAGVAGNAQIRLAPGIAPSSPNDGDIYYVDTNDRFMVRKGSLDSEILSASAQTTETIVPDKTLTITYNGTTLKIPCL